MEDSRGVKILIANAESGVILSMYRLARRYREGRGTDQNYQKALHWYFKIYDLIYDKAKDNLTLKGVDANDVADCISAMIDIAEMFEKGEGVHKDLEAAFTIYRRAVNLGVPDGLDLFVYLSAANRFALKARNKLIKLLQENPYLINEVNEQEAYINYPRHMELMRDDGSDPEITEANRINFQNEVMKNNEFRKLYAAGNFKIKTISPFKPFLIIWLLITLGFLLVACFADSSSKGEFTLEILTRINTYIIGLSIFTAIFAAAFLSKIK